MGIHTAIQGSKSPFVDKVEENWKNKMYEKEISNPNPIFVPIPSFVFLLESATAIMVSIIIANGKAILLCFSIKCSR